MRNSFDRLRRGDRTTQPSTSSSRGHGDALRMVLNDKEKEKIRIAENGKKELPKITKTIDDAIEIARSLDQKDTTALIFSSADDYDISHLIILTNEVKTWIKDHQGALGLTQKAYEKMREEYLSARKRSEKKPSDLRTKIYVKEQAVAFLEKVETTLKPWITDARDNLLNAFKENFPEAAMLIQDNPPALELVQEAARAGVQFGGYSEEGRSAETQALDKTVYVPRDASDPLIAMSDFLFELNNGIRSPLLLDLQNKARKRELTDKQFAHQVLELEVEGALRLGKIRSEMKSQMKKASENSPELGEIRSEMKKAGEDPPELDKYDIAFHLPEYQAYKNGQSKEDITKVKLTRIYKSGLYQGKTTEARYIEMYKELIAEGADNE